MTFNTNQAHTLREAIDKTIARLTPHPMGGGLPKVVLDQLTEHLGALLEQERLLFTTAAALSPTGANTTLPDIAATDQAFGEVTPSPPTADTPWYPDDSGEWVEVPDDVMDPPPGLKAHDLVETLLRNEREWRSHLEGPNSVDRWEWNTAPKRDSRIVAYKVVKP